MVKNIATARNDFPILNQQINGEPLTYLDNAATTQKPQVVIDALTHYYETDNANIHRGVYTLAERATEAYEGVRQQVANFINAQTDEVIFTRGTTTSLNWVALGFARQLLQPNDEIIITVMEHHSNLVPWQQVALQTGAKLRYIEIDEHGELDLTQYGELLNPKTKFVAFTHVSNVLGTINPVKQMTKMAHDVGAYVVIDGAQAVGHFSVDMTDLDCDFYAFSGHKVYGPTGIGVLYGKRELLAEMNPVEFGGEMINLVERQTTDFKPAPAKFEAGTMPIAQAIGLGAALDYLTSLGWSAIEEHEQSLVTAAYQQLNKIDGLTIYGPAAGPTRSALITFNLNGVHPHDVATVLDTQGVAVRAGHHCAQPLMQTLGVSATTRASFGLYNNLADVERLIAALVETKEFFQV
ncbi:aminotransferase, class V [Lapidilactobacillus dextrinicus DSM 20335]|uniref:Cysteine desulfurase n=1 Tax=Lapidilactobacillus dextrinicus DSM 20335 TaxID=1423738 RepID=A0A0R2BK11_9LACO|nr:cysteine desulfurase [Lapidilactobacillus dextrinicus]KRM79855.1 aminotransferase, class V [Lapidilactobacillus dextrinicus DSM 20335]QFG46360.1 cysteine desulfurase [Lapidilactobacillus dextrinicus]